MVYGFKTKAEKYSEEYRQKCNLSKFSKLDAFDLAKQIKVKFYKPSELLDSTHASHLAVLAHQNSDFHAMYVKLSDENKVIIYNDCHSIARQQSSIMHEIAHIILEHQIPDDVARLMLKYNLPYINSEQEEEAKFLGACLQLTKPALLWARKEKWSDAQIAEKYLCSIEMVEYRKKCLGLHRKWH